MSLRFSFLRLFVFFGFVFLIGQSAFAQYDPGCLNRVTHDFKRFETDTFLRLSFLSGWDQKKYDAARTQNSPALALPVIAGTVGTTRDFKDFKDRLDEEIRRVGFGYDPRQREAMLVSALSDADFQTWGGCFAEDHGGVFLRVKSADDKKIVLEFCFKPQPGTSSSTVNRAVMLGGKPIKPIKGAVFKPGAAQTFEIDRDPTIAFRLDIVTNTGLVGISVGPPPPPPVRETRIEIKEPKLFVSDGSDQDIEFPDKFTAPADGNYILDFGLHLTPSKTTPKCDQQGLDCYGICTRISILVNGTSQTFIDKWPPQCSGSPSDIRKPEDAIFDRRAFPLTLKKGDTVSFSAAINSGQGKVKVTGIYAIQPQPAGQ